MRISAQSIRHDVDARLRGNREIGDGLSKCLACHARVSGGVGPYPNEIISRAVPIKWRTDTGDIDRRTIEIFDVPAAIVKVPGQDIDFAPFFRRQEFRLLSLRPANIPYVVTTQCLGEPAAER